RTQVELAKVNVEMAEANQSGYEFKFDRLSKLAELSPDVGHAKELEEARMQLRAAKATVRAAQVKVKEAQDAEKLAQFGLEMTVVRARSQPQVAGESSRAKRRFIIIDKKVVLGQLVAPPA